MVNLPTVKMYEELVKAKRPRPWGFKISLSPEAILAVGHITLQWAALYESVLQQISVLRADPRVPEGLRNKTPDLRQESNITYLRELGRHVYANEREGAAAMFDRNICHIFAFKADRDKLAHGTFSRNDNTEFDGIVGIYKKKKFHLSAKRIQAVAEGIGRCNAFLFAEFDMWLHADERARTFRASLERPELQGPLPNAPYVETQSKPERPPESSQA